MVSESLVLGDSFGVDNEWLEYWVSLWGNDVGSSDWVRGMSILDFQDEALLRSLKVDKDDIAKGVSGFAKGKTVTMSMDRYQLMLNLIFKMKEDCDGIL